MKNKQAFTLIELLVVVLIIGILVAVAVPQYQKAVAKASMNNLLLVGRVLHEAQERYYLENGTYVGNLALLDVSINPADFRRIWAGRTIELADKRQPKLEYVWYPNHAYAKDSALANYNGRRECRVYDTDNELLKNLCREATGVTGKYVSKYWSFVFPK